MMAGPFISANGSQNPNPIHILSQEQARCMIAVKELHSQVAALLQFRSEVIKSLPHLDHKNQRTPVLSPVTTEVPNAPSTLQDPDDTFKLPNNKTRPRAAAQPQSRTPQATGPVITPSGVNPTHRMPRRTERARWGPTVKFMVVAQGRNWMRVRPCAPRTSKGAEDSDDCYDDGEEDDEEDELRSTSDELRSVVMGKVGKMKERKRDKELPRHHQKDSGFSTDTRAVETLEKPKRREVKQEDDELLRLLDDIEKKGSVLRKRVEELEPKGGEERKWPGTLADLGLGVHEVLTEMERLHRERDQLVDRLAEAATERDRDRLRLEELALVALDVQTVNRRLEERLMQRTVAEKRYLISQSASSESAPADVEGVKGRDPSWRQSTSKVAAFSLPMRLHLNQRQSMEQKVGTKKIRIRPDRERVSAILRESRVLELQRQLLVAVFENEVLKSRLLTESRRSRTSTPYGETFRQMSVESVPVERARMPSTPSSHASIVSQGVQSQPMPECPKCANCLEMTERSKGHLGRDFYCLNGHLPRDKSAPRYDGDYHNTNEPRSTTGRGLAVLEEIYPSRTNDAFAKSGLGTIVNSRHVCNGRVYNCGSA